MKWASDREANRRRWPFHHNRTANKEVEPWKPGQWLAATLTLVGQSQKASGAIAVVGAPLSPSTPDHEGGQWLSGPDRSLPGRQSGPSPRPDKWALSDHGYRKKSRSFRQLILGNNQSLSSSFLTSVSNPGGNSLGTS
jgi:hypothetical protein